MTHTAQAPGHLVERGFILVISGTAKEPIDALFSGSEQSRTVKAQHGRGTTHSEITTLLHREPDQNGQKLVIDQVDQLFRDGSRSDRLQTIIEFLEHGRDLYARVTQGGMQVNNGKQAKAILDNALLLMESRAAAAA